MLLKVVSLQKSFGGVIAADDVSFEVERAKLVALIGPNGAGKSTIFNMVGGQLKPDAGRVLLDGEDITGLDSRHIWRKGVGRTFQVAQDFVSMSVVENVQMALMSVSGEMRALWSGAANRHRDEAMAVLDRVGMIEQAERPCSVLAYGDVKRLELAIAMASQPKLLLMDEPTAGMAPKERVATMELAAAIAAEHGIGILFTEHDMNAVFSHADRILVLVRGELIAGGTPTEVRSNEHVKQAYLGESVTAVEAQGLPEERVEAVTSERTHSPLLRVKSLSAAYGRAQVLFDVTIVVRTGEVVALLGRNGAGKSTTLKAIMGLVDAKAGDLVFGGVRIAGLPSFKIARLGLGYVPEERRIFTDLSVEENLKVGTRPARGGHEPWTPERVFNIFPNLAEMRDRRAIYMSGGEQQMLTIARTLMGNPQAVLLDEPSEGLAPVIIEQMAEAILRMKAEGVAVLLSEQNLHFASAVSDRAYVIDRGNIRYEGTIADIIANESVQSAYLTV